MIADNCVLDDFVAGIVSWCISDLIHGDWQLRADNITSAIS